RLLNETSGELIEGRCNSTNLCDYCSRLAAVLNAEMTIRDTLNGGAAPTIFCVLTTRTATLDMSGFYDSRRQVFKALRRRWPEVQIATVLEFTTGTGERAQGARRPHWNLLLKNVPADDVDQVADVITKVWCAREDALPRAQHFQRVHAIEGLSRYLMLHFQKYSQAPPPGFRGHRFTHTRGYFHEGTKATRAAAKEDLARKRALWRALGRGLSGQAAEDAVTREREHAAQAQWRLLDIEAVRLAERRRTSARAPAAPSTAAHAEHAAVKARRPQDGQHRPQEPDDLGRAADAPAPAPSPSVPPDPIPSSAQARAELRGDAGRNSPRRPLAARRTLSGHADQDSATFCPPGVAPWTP
ncbi:MAG: hypothetical protein JHD16_18650, partial [Solirubrobacteraceae bacterium]|nr:hypothetical protein [Solirubrobacteraceae bacterium]